MAEKFSKWMKDINAQIQVHSKPKARQTWEGHASAHHSQTVERHIKQTNSKRKTTHSLQGNNSMRRCLLTSNYGGQKRVKPTFLKCWKKKINLPTQNSINSKNTLWEWGWNKDIFRKRKTMRITNNKSK